MNFSNTPNATNGHFTPLRNADIQYKWTPNNNSTLAQTHEITTSEHIGPNGSQSIWNVPRTPAPAYISPEKAMLMIQEYEFRLQRGLPLPVLPHALQLQLQRYQRRLHELQLRQDVSMEMNSGSGVGVHQRAVRTQALEPFRHVPSLWQNQNAVEKSDQDIDDLTASFQEVAVRIPAHWETCSPLSSPTTEQPAWVTDDTFLDIPGFEGRRLGDCNFDDSIWDKLLNDEELEEGVSSVHRDDMAMDIC